MDKKERQLSSNAIRTTAGYSFTYRIKQMFLGNCSRTDLRRIKLYCQTINGPVTPEIMAWRLPLIAELVKILSLLEILAYFKGRYIHKSIPVQSCCLQCGIIVSNHIFFWCASTASQARFVEPWFCQFMPCFSSFFWIVTYNPVVLLGFHAVCRK